MNQQPEIDVQILKELLKDGRKSFTALATQLHTSKDIVWKHYTNMVSDGIIVGATVQLDHPKFGLGQQATILLSVESQYVASVFERLTKIPDITCFRYHSATFSMGAICHLRSLSDLENVKELISKETPINEIKASIWTGVRNIPENIFPNLSDGDQTDDESAVADGQATINLDDVDLQIVKMLKVDGRLPLSNIAKQIGVSTDTVVRRYTRLRKNNYLKVSVQFNPEKLGYQAILNISLALTDQSKTKEVADMLSTITGITYLLKISGNYDLLAVALVKDFNDMFSIDEQIMKIPYIKRVDTGIRSVYPMWPLRSQSISNF